MTQRTFNYAKVLFDLNISEDILNNTRDMLLDNDLLLGALTNPAVSKKEKHAIIDKFFAEEIRSYLKVLCDNNALELIGDILDAYEELVLEKKKIIKATLAYVSRPEPLQLEKIKEFICEKFKKEEVILDLKEDPSLLGGFILTVGDIQYDKSLLGTLSSLQKTLIWR